MDVPHQIGRYPVTAVLGRGSMGVVFRGRDEALDREVALKVMATASADDDACQRFRREALAAARLQHPNIVTIYELGEHEGRPFIAMELLEGTDLRAAIEAGLRPDPTSTLPIVLQVLAGLAHAHEHGVVHRDVKPSNVFLPQRRPAKLMDFGVARLGAGGTTAGAIVGTPNYMSPEQVQGQAVDGRSDLFSVGLILYELVTGERAFAGDSVVTVLYKIAHESPDLSLLPRDPRWTKLREVLERSLAREPGQRYAAAEAMASDLTLALAELGGSPSWATAASPQVAARRPTLPPPSADSAGVAVRAVEERPFRPTASQIVVGAILAAVVLTGGVLGGLAWIRHTAPRPGISSAPPAPPQVATEAEPAGGTRASAPPIVEETRTPAPPTPSPRPAAAAPDTKPDPARVEAETPRPQVEEPPAEPEPVRPPAHGTQPRGDIDLANALLEQRRYRSALDAARAILARNPSHREAQIIAEDAEAALVVEERLDAARAAMRRGDPQAALDEVRGGLAVAPNDARLMELFRELTR